MTVSNKVLKSKIMKYLLIFSMLFFGGSVGAQNVQKHYELIDTDYYYPQMPVAGYDLSIYLSEHLHYPDSAMAHNLEGRVIVKFMVNEDGTISDCQIARGLSKECDSEALRVLRIMPPWKPGKQKGKPYKVPFYLPIQFILMD